MVRPLLIPATIGADEGGVNGLTNMGFGTGKRGMLDQ